MASDMRICKICGKEYPACNTEVRGALRWKDVACCPEHGEEYFKLVAIARGEVTPDAKAAKPGKAAKVTPKVEAKVEEAKKPEDDDFDEDADDADEYEEV